MWPNREQGPGTARGVVRGDLGLSLSGQSAEPPQSRDTARGFSGSSGQWGRGPGSAQPSPRLQQYSGEAGVFQTRVHVPAWSLSFVTLDTSLNLSVPHFLPPMSVFGVKAFSTVPGIEKGLK